MIKKIAKRASLLVLALTLLVGCEWMPLQTDYKYESSVSDPYMNLTAMEYFNTRTDLFSTLIEALEYTELSTYYTQVDHQYTFLALTNTAMKSYMQSVFPGKTSIRDCDKATVRKMLLYHIVDGAYSSYTQLQVTPMFVLTELRGGSGLMTMLVRKNPWQADVGKIVINDTGSNQKSPVRSAISSNLMPTNGVIHVFDAYCYFSK